MQRPVNRRRIVRGQLYAGANKQAAVPDVAPAAETRRIFERKLVFSMPAVPPFNSVQRVNRYTNCETEQ